MSYRQVPDFPDYQVSPGGRVRNRFGQILYQEKTDSGYMRVRIARDGRKRNVRVHRLVLEAFVGPCPAGMECRHLDGNKTNNHLTNLMWGTPLQNLKDSVRLGIIRSAGYLTERRVRRIRRSRRSNGYWSRRFGVCSWTIRMARSYRSWKHVL